MSPDTAHLDAISMLAGDCTVRFEDGDDQLREERGSVLAVLKPDGTLLVHDREGYRPAAWLTRAETVSTRSADNGAVIDALDGDRRLVVTCHEEHGYSAYPVTGAGPPAGDCPACDGPLVRTPAAVECLDCTVRHAIPRDATVLSDRCETCGSPRMRVDRGAALACCVDRECESMDDLVRERFDGAWDCPACGSPLRILRRGGLIAGCGAYPDCETAFAIPAGIHVGTCGVCGLPAFGTGSGRRCLDASCSGPA